MARPIALGNPVIFQGDTSNHGGMVISGHDAWTAKGANGSNIPVARVTDMFSCPKHGVNPIIYSPESGINIMGQLAALQGARTACGAILLAKPGLIAENVPVQKLKLVAGTGELVPVDNHLAQSQTQSKKECTHSTDGAIKVAEYIVQEIKTNVKSLAVKQMQILLNPPWYLKMLPSALISNRISALAIWTYQVRQDGPWDHKPKIKDKFKSVAVHRPTEKGKPSETHYHKYKRHDYFLDIWSNIHYGYVGAAAGLSNFELLDGAGLEQVISDEVAIRKERIKRSQAGPKSGEKKWTNPRDFDDIPDSKAINLGIDLFKKYGLTANALTASVLLSALETIPSKGLGESRVLHVCLDNSEKPIKFTID